MITTTEKSKYIVPQVELLLSEDGTSAKMNPLKIFMYQRSLPEKQSTHTAEYLFAISLC